MIPRGFAPGLTLLLLWNATACVAPAREQAPADLIVTNAVIYTGNPEQPWAESLAVRGGRLAHVGAADRLAALRGPHTQSFDAGGKLVLPAFHDAHVHPVTSGIELGQCDLNGAATVT